ncbi:unnamed protein product [Adineta steineri]|uniref:RING-type domain-containing protein n=1 Tax=Adineta steineri TaxID=433720 RepID=A0A815FID5_9BILA|nr:unnamed protein product [Adineta steineri]CAF1327129.1 unnamed protein product [Adineta steineri]
MTSIQQKGISSERISQSTSVNVDDLECSICRDLLWKPVACRKCETPFCSTCMNRWLANRTITCPTCCDTYIERKCPPFVTKVLSHLQIICFYQANGCQEILPYEALDKHEIECGYQFAKCPGCQLEMLKKDFLNHKKSCELVPMTCKDCKLMYKRNEATTKHTEKICLRKQLKRLKHEYKESKGAIQKLNIELREIRHLYSSIKPTVITFEDLPSAAKNLLHMPNVYKGFRWTKISYMHELLAIKKYSKSGYVSSFLPGDSLHVGFFGETATISIEPPNETFSLISIMACAAWNDDLELTITAYRKSIEVNQHSVILLFGRPQRIMLQWKNIDKVVFKPSGGTAHPGCDEGPGAHVSLTQLTIDDLSLSSSNFLTFD